MEEMKNPRWNKKKMAKIQSVSQSVSPRRDHPSIERLFRYSTVRLFMKKVGWAAYKKDLIERERFTRYIPFSLPPPNVPSSSTSSPHHQTIEPAMDVVSPIPLLMHL